ncbi:putative ABC transporter permease/ATP-binding protein [Comamonas sp. E6]|nr:putative ABC transporter permease/ATP-binding protein [Comamonas sp. E6]
MPIKRLGNCAEPKTKTLRHSTEIRQKRLSHPAAAHAARSTQHAARSTHVQLAALLPAHMGLRAELVPLHGQKEPKSRLSFIGLRYWIAPAICGPILPALFFRERF